MSDTDHPEWLSLDPDEDVVWIGRPAFETLYGSIATGLVLTVVLVGVLILLGIPFSYYRIENTDYVVTTESLYVKTGVLSTNIETVDIDRIQNTEYNRSFWGERFDYGTISISTAGSSGAEISFSGIPDAPSVRDHITDLRRTRSGRGRDDGTGGTGVDADTDTTPASADQVAELIAEVRATREAFERIERHLTDGDGTADATTTGTEVPTDDTDTGRDG
jgi:uncharacterized membrane protein YdbT with pleckstrin-like domain